jgi:hypothetical protein
VDDFAVKYVGKDNTKQVEKDISAYLQLGTGGRITKQVGGDIAPYP